MLFQSGQKAGAHNTCRMGHGGLLSHSTELQFKEIFRRLVAGLKLWNAVGVSISMKISFFAFPLLPFAPLYF